MSAQQQTKTPPIVFISYAHENESLRVAVRILADWLGQHGCKPLTDHAFGYRPPPEGWQAWMLGCIHQADIVLVVCTPKLRQRYEKTGDLDSGRGATYEGAIVTQHIYDDIMRNDKFYPILPDEGSESDIPMALKSWWNGHRFPSGSEGIRRMIFNEPVEEEIPSSSTDNSDTSDRFIHLDSHHQELANQLLAEAAAKPFYEALKNEFARFFPKAPVSQSTFAMVHSFAQCPADEVKRLFFAVRGALKRVPPSGLNPAARRQAEEAAAALYCMAACRLVDQAIQETPTVPYVLRVPSSERVICAVIATALFGGVLRLLPPEEETGLPRPEFVFEVRVPASGVYVVGSFERAVYVALFPNDRALPEVAQDSGRLDSKLCAKLATQFDDIKFVERGSLALVVHGLGQPDLCAGFASQYQVPVMLPDTEATAVLLGMDADRLLAEIQKFWDALEALPCPTLQTRPQPSSPSPLGATPMPSIPQITGDHTTVIFSAGDHSALQSGTGNIANITQREGSGLSALTPFLAELLREIGEVPLPKPREILTAHAQAAQAEAVKPDKPDPDVIKNALVKVKASAEMLEDGGKIIGLCNQAYNILASIFALPPSPLP